jgi:hypothetical protein
MIFNEATNARAGRRRYATIHGSEGEPLSGVYARPAAAEEHVAARAATAADRRLLTETDTRELLAGGVCFVGGLPVTREALDNSFVGITNLLEVMDSMIPIEATTACTGLVRFVTVYGSANERVLSLVARPTAAREHSAACAATAPDGRVLTGTYKRELFARCVYCIGGHPGTREVLDNLVVEIDDQLEVLVLGVKPPPSPMPDESHNDWMLRTISASSEQIRRLIATKLPRNSTATTVGRCCRRETSGRRRRLAGRRRSCAPSRGRSSDKDDVAPPPSSRRPRRGLRESL